MWPYLINPLKPSEMSHSYQMDQFIHKCFKVCWVVFFIQTLVEQQTGDVDQMPHFEASDHLGLHGFPMSNKKDTHG